MSRSTSRVSLKLNILDSYKRFINVYFHYLHTNTQQPIIITIMRRGGHRGPRNESRNTQARNNAQGKGYSTEIITDPAEFYALKEDAGVKANQYVHPNIPQLHIADFGLSGRGPIQDKIYADYVFYRNNIRRGNTVARAITQQKEEKFFWLRKGLRKFFDIRYEYLDGELKGNHEHYATFREIENILSLREIFEGEPQNHPQVRVFKLLKANGENTQIGYFAKTDSWVVGSKNVCIVVNTRAQIASYKEERFNFAKIMAEAWFNILEEQKYTEVQLRALKEWMAGKTLIGEYCGNPKYQHIVKYDKETIYFYAVVDNESAEVCLPPDESLKHFLEFKLPFVRGFQKSHIGTFNKLSDLYGFLQKIFSQVAHGKIEDEEEGSVVYFVLDVPQGAYEYAMERKMQDRFYIPEKLKPMNSWVPSLAKLKTLEYRIWRKLREKLKKVLGPMDDKELIKECGDTLARFEKEVIQLVGKEELQKPLEYYFYIALLAFKYIQENRKGKNGPFANPLEGYIDFLNILFFCAEKGMTAVPSMLADEELVLKLRGEDWRQYSLNVKEQYETLLAAMYPNYVKIKAIKMIQKDEEPQEYEPE